MESKLINYQKVLTEEKSKLDKVLASYRDNNETVKKAASRIDYLYASDLSTRKPKIMVYGIYNAGKSSIINELLQDDKAKVADVPTTDKVTAYEWNGYMISDTPGVAAPIQHEKITMEALKENDVVIFVMSTTGSFEKAENYERIKDIVQAGKKVILVLNDKNGYLFQGDEQSLKNLEDIKQQVFNNMEKVGINSAEKYVLIVVDADLAKNGRLQNDADDIRQSNFAELERAVLSELKNTSSYRLLRNDVQLIIENIGIAIKEIALLDDVDEVSKKINEILENISSYKADLRSTMQNYIKTQSSVLGRDLVDIIWDNRNNQEKLNAEVSERYDRTVERVSKKLAQQFSDMQMTIAPDLENLIDELGKIKVNLKTNIKIDANQSSEYVAYSIPNLDEEKMQKLLKELNNIWDVLKNMRQYSTSADWVLPAVQKGLLANMAGSAANAAFVTDTSKVVADLVTKGTVGKVISAGLAKIGVGSLVPYIGPAVSTLLLLYNLLKDNKEARIAEANERRRQIAEAEAKAKLELQQKCKFAADDFEDELSLTVSDIIIKTCNDFQNKLEEQSEVFRDRHNNIANDVKELRAISEEYHSLSLQLGSEN